MLERAIYNITGMPHFSLSYILLLTLTPVIQTNTAATDAGLAGNAGEDWPDTAEDAAKAEKSDENHSLAAEEGIADRHSEEEVAVGIAAEAVLVDTAEDRDSDIAEEDPADFLSDIAAGVEESGNVAEEEEDQIDTAEEGAADIAGVVDLAADSTVAEVPVDIAVGEAVVDTVGEDLVDIAEEELAAYQAVHWGLRVQTLGPGM